MKKITIFCLSSILFSQFSLAQPNSHITVDATHNESSQNKTLTNEEKIISSELSVLAQSLNKHKEALEKYNDTIHGAMAFLSYKNSKPITVGPKEFKQAVLSSQHEQRVFTQQLSRINFKNRQVNTVKNLAIENFRALDKLNQKTKPFMNVIFEVQGNIYQAQLYRTQLDNIADKSEVYKKNFFAKSEEDRKLLNQNYVKQMQRFTDEKSAIEKKMQLMSDTMDKKEDTYRKQFVNFQDIIEPATKIMEANFDKINIILKDLEQQNPALYEDNIESIRANLELFSKTIFDN